MNAPELLAALGKRYGMALAFNPQGVCSLRFDEDDIDFEISSDVLFVIANVGAASESASFYRTLLELNLKSEETADAYFGLDSNHNEVIFVKKLPSSMEYEDFEKELVCYVQALRRWKQKLPELSTDTEATAFDISSMGLRV